MLVLIAVSLFILLIAFVFGVVLPKRRRKAARYGPIPIAAFGRGEIVAIPPRPSRLPPPAQGRAAAAPVQDTPEAPAAPTPSPSVFPIDLHTVDADEVGSEDRRRIRRMHVAGERRDSARDSARDSSRDDRSAVTLRLERPMDGTLQFLPGRLEVIDGREVGQEIKFVRTPGPDGTTISFGRAEGALYRHVQLFEPTVSRLHAKLVLDGTTWSLVNLSATNPVVVNGLRLAGEGASAVLREGDRIEMGEVVFRFHAK